MTTSFLFQRSRGNALAVILIIVSLILVGGAVAIGLQQQKNVALPLEEYEAILQGIDELSQSVQTELVQAVEDQQRADREVALERVVTDLSGEPCSSECILSLESFGVNEIFSNSLGAVISVKLQAPVGTYNARMYDELNVPLSLETVLVAQADGTYTADLILSARPAGGSGTVIVKNLAALDVGIIVPILFQYDMSVISNTNVSSEPEDLPCGLTVTSPVANQILDKTFEITGWVTGCGWHPFEGISGLAYLVSGAENPVIISEKVSLEVDTVMLEGEDMYEVMISGRPLPVRATLSQNETSNINRVSLIIQNQSMSSGETTVRIIYPVRLTTSGYVAPEADDFCGLVVLNPQPFATQTSSVNIEGYVDGCGWRNYEGSYGTVQIFRNGEPRIAVSEKIPFTATPLTVVIPPTGKAVFSLNIPHTALSSEIGVIVFEGEAVAEGEFVPRAEFPIRF